MKIRVGAFDYELVYFDNEVVEKEEGGDQYKLFGNIDFETMTINVWKGLHPQVVPQVILHEIVHGILRNAGYEDHSEELINAITNGLISLSRDNPSLVHFNFQ